MRVLALVLALATFVILAALCVSQEVQASQLAYDRARQEEYARGLQRRIDAIEARLLVKFPPQVLYRVATEFRSRRAVPSAGVEDGSGHSIDAVEQPST